MTSSGLISVIVPTYNRARLCKEAVESVLSQTYSNVEVLVVDDGSSDNTRDVIDGMDKRVRYISQQNAGVSSARNHGLALASGEYIALLDSDDSWFPWKLECQMQVLKYFASAGMVWTDMTAIDEHGKVLHETYIQRMYSNYRNFDRESNFRISKPLGSLWDGCPELWSDRKCYTGNIFPQMFRGNLVHTSTVLLRKERQKTVGGFNVDLLKSGEDYDFHLRTCRAGDVAYVDVPSISYRIGCADQLTTNKYKIWMARNNLKTVFSVLPEMQEIGVSNEIINKRMAEAYAWLGACEMEEDPDNARIHLHSSLQYDPFQMSVYKHYIMSLFSRESLDLLRRVKKTLVD